MNNQAFIDGQNLSRGTTLSEKAWKIDLYKFRRYLQERYSINKAYYFIGCLDENLQDLYDMIQDAGFILVFRAHGGKLVSHKKGNVDTDVVFTIMKNYHEYADIDKFFLVSGDGDYYKTVKYLLDHGKLGKLLFPAHHKASSLYRQIGGTYYDYLDSPDIKKKIKLAGWNPPKKIEGFA